MSNTGFTIGYNCILRDQSLSLATKGLYLVVSSYIGMPEWKLTKDALNKICGTAYAVKKAWSRLSQALYCSCSFRRIYPPIRADAGAVCFCAARICCRY